MSFLSRLFKAKEPLPSIDHPFLGKTSAVIDHGDGRYFWQMEDDIDTPIGPISASFDAGSQGPSDEQVRDFQSVVADFETVRADAKALLTATLRDFGHEAKFDELKPVGFGFYDSSSTDVDWDVSFELPSECFLYTVCFKSGAPTIVHADS